MRDLVDQLHDYGDALEARVGTVTADDAMAAAGPPGGSPRGSRRMWLVTAAAALLVVVALGGVLVSGGRVRLGGSADDLALRDALTARRFVVSSITEGGRPKVLTGPALNGEPAIGVIAFGDTFLSSSGGCNSTGTEFDVVDGRLVTFGEGSSTVAACSQPEVMAQDAWLVAVLGDSPAVAVDGDRLTLRTATTTIELVERAAPPDPPSPTTTVLDRSLLTGRTFVATAALVNGVERRIVGPAGEPEPHRLRISFGDGTARVSAGCNSGTGPYTLDQGRIEGLAITTERACSQDLMDQDAWLNTVFSTPPSLTLDGDYLTLGNQIDTIIVFVDEAASTPEVAPSPLFGPRWSLDPASVPDFPASFKGQLYVYLLLTDGEPQTAYLRDGCNVVTGGVRVDPTSATSGSLTMGELDRTDASCPPPFDQIVAVMTEIQTGTWSYVIDTDRLELTNGNRTVVFRVG